MNTTTTATRAEKARLDRLTRGPEPTADVRAKIAQLLVDTVNHANERTAFYAQCDMHDTAEEWSEFAVEANATREAIEADTWAWVTA
jgi:hypothetical protein